MIQETESRSAVQKRTYDLACTCDWQDALSEPTLDEILADPIVHLVLGRDHLEIRDVERFLRSASERLTERRQSPNFGRVKLRETADHIGA